MHERPDERNWHPIGHAWLRRELGLQVPPPAVESYVVSGARRTEDRGSRIINLYPRQYSVDRSPVSHLRFALRHEPVDLGVLSAALSTMDSSAIEEWVRAEPTGAFSRRAWFFHELVTGRTLDLEDVRVGNYVDALNPSFHVVSERRNSKRHRVADNLLGGPGLCPTVRRTPRLTELMELRIDEEARNFISNCDPAIVARTTNFLFTKETRASFAIEGEVPSASRESLFVAALMAASAMDPSNRSELLSLQGKIVDSRYAATDWRECQIFVGQTMGGYRERVHFIGPRPEDVPGLMDGWTALTRRVREDNVNAVVAAAVSAFAFVFVHPFEDGNGRIHRFLMHHMLANRGYSPPGTIFPISAAILRDRRGYDEVLETFSGPVMKLLQWSWTKDREISVENESRDLYRFFDATGFAEYLYDRIIETVRTDLNEEAEYITVFDRAFNDVREIVDMPDRRASLLVRLCMQNGGKLSKSKRKIFAELTESEIKAMEAAIQEATRASGPMQ